MMLFKGIYLMLDGGSYGGGSSFKLDSDESAKSKPLETVKYQDSGFEMNGVENDSINLQIKTSDTIRVLNITRSMLPISQGTLALSAIKKESITERGAESGCPADINNDGVVDVNDLLEIIISWGQDGGPADINNDGIVDVGDLIMMIDEFGPCDKTDNWVEQKISPSDGEQGDNFGKSLVLGDNTLIVGSTGAAVDGFPYVGAVYVYKYENSTGWVQTQKILGEVVTTNYQHFGHSLDLYEVDNSLVLNEDRIIIGAINDAECGWDAGAAYIYKKNPDGQWVKEQKLIAWDCGNESWPHLFSSSVAIFDSYAFVGAYGDSSQGIATGAVYVFKWNGNSWSQHQKLIATDGTEFDWFGNSLSASRDVLIVGAMYDDRHPSGPPITAKGGAYVFKLDADGYWQQHYPQLEAADGEHYDGFGSSVAIHENAMIVGARYTYNDNGTRGAVYIFKEDADGDWDQLYKLMPGDEGINDGYFGSSIDVLGESLLVGTDAWDGEETGPGSLYLFERVSNTEWVQVNRFVASDGINTDWFGATVSLWSNANKDKERCAVGARRRNLVYVYERGYTPPYRDDFDSWKYAYDLATEKNSQAAGIVYQEMIKRFGTLSNLALSSYGLIDQSENLYIDFFEGSIRINGVLTKTLVFMRDKKYKLFIPTLYSNFSLTKDGFDTVDLSSYYSSSLGERYNTIEINSSIINENLLYLNFHSYKKTIKLKIISKILNSESVSFSSTYIDMMSSYDFQLSDSDLWRFKTKDTINVGVSQKNKLSRQWGKGGDHSYNIFGLSQPDLYLINNIPYNFKLSYNDYPVALTSGVSIGSSAGECNISGTLARKVSEDVHINSMDKVFAKNINKGNTVIFPRFIKLEPKYDGKINIKTKMFFDSEESVLLRWDSEHPLLHNKQTDVIARGILRINSQYDPTISKRQGYQNVIVKDIFIDLSDVNVKEDFDIRFTCEGAKIIHDRVRVIVDGNAYPNSVHMDVKVVGNSNGYNFKIREEDSPGLKFISGNSYTFMQSDLSNSKGGYSNIDHPLFLTTSNSSLQDGGLKLSNGVSIRGGLESARVLTFKPIDGVNDFSNIKYTCETGPLSYGNNIYIADEINIQGDPYWTNSLVNRIGMSNCIMSEGDSFLLTPREEDSSYVYYQSIDSEYMGGKVFFTDHKHGYDISNLTSQEGLNSSDFIDIKFSLPGKYAVYNNDFYHSGHYFVINVSSQESVDGGKFNNVLYDQYFNYSYPFDLTFRSQITRDLSNDISLGFIVDSPEVRENSSILGGAVASLGTGFSYYNFLLSSDISQMSAQGLGSTLKSFNASKKYSIENHTFSKNDLSKDEVIVQWNSWSTSPNYLNRERFESGFSDKTFDYVDYLSKFRSSNVNMGVDKDFDIVLKSYGTDSDRVISKIRSSLLLDSGLKQLSFSGVIKMQFGLNTDIVSVLNESLDNRSIFEFSDSIIVDIDDSSFKEINDASFMGFMSNLEFAMNSIEDHVGRKVDVIKFNLNNIIREGKYSALDIASLIIKLKSFGIDRYMFNVTPSNILYDFMNTLRISVLQTYLSAKDGGRDGLSLLVNGESTLIESADSRKISVVDFYRDSSPRSDKISNWWMSDSSVNILSNKMDSLVKNGVERIFLKYPMGIRIDDSVLFDQISEIDEDKRYSFLESILNVSSLGQNIEVGLFVGISDLLSYYRDDDGWDLSGLRIYLSDICESYSKYGIRAVAIKMDMNSDLGVDFMEEAFELFRTIIIEYPIRVYFYGFYLNKSRMFGNLLMKYPSIIDEAEIVSYYSNINVNFKGVEWHII